MYPKLSLAENLQSGLGWLTSELRPSLRACVRCAAIQQLHAQACAVAAGLAAACSGRAHIAPRPPAVLAVVVLWPTLGRASYARWRVPAVSFLRVALFALPFNFRCGPRPPAPPTASGGAEPLWVLAAACCREAASAGPVWPRPGAPPAPLHRCSGLWVRWYSRGAPPATWGARHPTSALAPFTLHRGPGRPATIAQPTPVLRCTPPAPQHGCV